VRGFLVVSIVAGEEEGHASASKIVGPRHRAASEHIFWPCYDPMFFEQQSTISSRVMLTLLRSK